MYKLFLTLLITTSIVLSDSFAVDDGRSDSLSTEDPILEIDVDGTTGFLRGKQLTSMGKNERTFITFRNIPFALEPERFMVNMLRVISML